MSDPELTDRQRDYISCLPCDDATAAEQMGITTSTIHDHRAALRDNGVDVRKDSDAGLFYLADSESQQLRQISTTHKNTITKEATALIEEEKKTLMRRLRATEPLQAEPVESPDKETFCVILSDLHFGDVVEKEFWDEETGKYQTQTVYSPKIARQRVERFTEKALKLKETVSAKFDDCAIFLLGDTATGESIYEGQWQHTEAGVNEQVEQSVTALYRLISTLSHEFETVQVRAIPGNHGTDKPSASLGVNTDVITYSWVDDRLRDTAHKNIDMRYAEAQNKLNTTIRGWKVHLRHGEEGMQHVDKTSRSESDWRGWQEETQFDLAMRGHYHTPSFDKVMNKYPVFTAPSPKPGGEFASRIGSPDVSRVADLGWIFGISDSRPVTWQYLIDAKV